MKIEVTNSTFYKLFLSSHFVESETLERVNNHYYDNPELEQKGIIMYNFVSRVSQYYLIDINY